MYVAMKVNQTFISQQFNEEGSIWGGGGDYNEKQYYYKK